MSNKDLVIINNEKISNEKNCFYCDNIDIKSIPEELDKNFKVTLIARDSKIERTLDDSALSNLFITRTEPQLLDFHTRFNPEQLHKVRLTTMSCRAVNAVFSKSSPEMGIGGYPNLALSL